MQALSEGNRSIGCQRSEAACASFLLLVHDVVQQKSETRHPWSTRPCGVVRQIGDIGFFFTTEYIFSYGQSQAHSVCTQIARTEFRDVVGKPCVCFSRVLRPTCMKLDFIRPLRACSSSTASAYRCDCLLLSACYSCAQPRFHLSAYQGRFHYAAKQPACHFPASLHSHVALNRMFMLFCGVVVHSHDHLASILASLSCLTYCASTLEPAVRRPALLVFFPSSNTRHPDPILNVPVDLPH